MKIAVLAGGKSSEHDVSLASAESVRAGLVAAGHEALDIRVSPAGEWSCEGEPVVLTPGHGLKDADVAFPAMHGPYGEDGVIQGVLEVLDIPYVGSNVAASALCMDKLDCKDLLGKARLPQVEYAHFGLQRWQDERGKVLDEASALGFPLFVKPARLGSSVGISKVHAPNELPPALEAALSHDSLVLVEAMAPGKEVECSVLGTVNPQLSVPGEIRITAEWYDYETKYTPGAMELKVPADISTSAAEKVQRIAGEAFHRTGCSGLARIDFFVQGEAVLISEINTMPGFTTTSVYPKLMEASGVSFAELLERLLEDAKQRYRYVRGFTH